MPPVRLALLFLRLGCPCSLCWLRLAGLSGHLPFPLGEGMSKQHSLLSG